MNPELDALIVQNKKNAEDNNILLETLVAQGEKNKTSVELEAIAKANIDTKETVNNSSDKVVAAINGIKQDNTDVVASVEALSEAIQAHYRDKRDEDDKEDVGKGERHKKSLEFRKEIIDSINKIATSFPEIPEAVNYSAQLNSIITELRREDKEADFSAIEGLLASLVDNVLKIGFPAKLTEKERVKVSLSKEDITELSSALAEAHGKYNWGGGGGYERVYLKNEAGAAINPATEEKQDDILAKMPELESGSVPVRIQDQVTQPIALRMNKVVQQGLTLATDTVIDSRTITMTTGHGLVAGNNIILLQENGVPKFFYAKILSVATNVLTLDTLVPYPFTALGTLITQYDPQLNKDGSTTVYKAELRNPFTIPIDLTRMIVHITDESAMDDGLFGGRAALTRGVAIRKNFVEGGPSNHFFNAKTNGEMGELTFDKVYDPKAPAGVYGFSARLTFAGQDKFGVAIRLNQGEAVELLIQDNLTLLNSFNITIEGHFTEGEG